MKDLGRLMSEAQRVAARALKRADATVNGTARARTMYLALPEQSRRALRETVVSQFGESAWRDFERAIGAGGEDGTTEKSA